MIGDKFNITFHKADCYFIKYVLDKFKYKLPYKGQHKEWTIMNNYSDKAFSIWNVAGRVPPRAVNMLNKDLCILRQSDSSIPTIEELYKEFLEFKKNKSRAN